MLVAGVHLELLDLRSLWVEVGKHTEHNVTPREGERALLTQKGIGIFLYLLWTWCPVRLEILIVRVLSPRKVSELSVCLPCALSSAPPFSG